MSGDPIELAANQAIMLASAEIEAELKSRRGTGPTIEVLKLWRKNAIVSMRELVVLNVYDPKDRIAIATHQNEIKRYAEYAICLKKIFYDGIALDKAATQEERRELIAIIRGMPEEDRALIDMGDDREDIEGSDD